MAEDRWKAPVEVRTEARRLARHVSGVDAARLQDIGHAMPVGVSTLLALLASGVNGRLGAWAARTYAAQVDVVRDREVEALTAAAVQDVDGVAYYGIHAPDTDIDMISWVLRASAAGHDQWTGVGWVSVPDDALPVGYRYSELTGPLLADALTATTAGGGLVLRAVNPRVLLPRRVPLTASVGTRDGVYAVTDEADTTAVVSMLRIDGGECAVRGGGEWHPDHDTLVHVVASGAPVAAIPPADLPMLLRSFDDHEVVWPIVAADAMDLPMTDADPDTDTVDTGTPDFTDGVMVALPIDDGVAQQLSVPGGLDPSDMHVTLAYLGDRGDVPVDADTLASLVSDWAGQQRPFAGEISGPATFEGTDNADNPVQVALVDCPDLPALRQSLVDHLQANGVDPVATHGYTPHITRQYGPQDLGNGIGGTPLSFDAVSVHHGTDRADIPLGGVTAAFNPSEARDPTGKWTSGGGGTAQNQQLEADRKVSAPHAAPKAPVVKAKHYKPPGGGGGGGGAKKAAAKKAAAARKAIARKAAQAEKTRLRDAAHAEIARMQDAETAQHTAVTRRLQAEALAERQKEIEFITKYAGMGSAAERKSALAGERSRKLAYQKHRMQEEAAETKRHQTATDKVKADVKRINDKLKADLAKVDADLAKTVAAADKAPVKASAEPVVADAVAHTRTPHQLQEYWTRGKGAAKIAWGAPGDYNRCIAELSKYVHSDRQVHGQCASLHKIATGIWPATHAKLDRGG